MTAKIDVPQQDPVVGVAHVVTDEVVVQRKRTFDAFYQDSYRTVLRLVWAMAGSHAAAEDLTQDAFVVASRRWAEVSSLDDPLGWVKRVALNRASSAFHRRKAEARALLRSGPPPATTQPTMPAESQHVWVEVARLPKRQRQAIALCYVEGLTRQQAADLMGISDETVKTHLDRARSTLASALKEERS